MKLHPLTLPALALLLAAAAPLAASPRQLTGTVYLAGPRLEPEPAANVQIRLRATGRTAVTDDHGEFLLELPVDLRPGDRITFAVDKPGWVLAFPYEGEDKLPAERGAAVTLRLMPRGWQQLLTPERMQRLLEDAFDLSKRQTSPEGGSAAPDYQS